MLTDTACKKATCPPDKKRERIADAGGLYLEISPNGSKRWFWKYRKQGKEGRMALGSYPDVGLAVARTARDTAKNIKAGGFDPVQERKLDQLKAAASAGQTFEVVAHNWHAKRSPGWGSHHQIRELRDLQADTCPRLSVHTVGQVARLRTLQGSPSVTPQDEQTLGRLLGEVAPDCQRRAQAHDDPDDEADNGPARLLLSLIHL